jgi:DNA polymerase
MICLLRFWDNFPSEFLLHAKSSTLSNWNYLINMVDYNKLRKQISDIEQNKGISNFFSGAIFKDSPWFIAKKALPKSSTKEDTKIIKIDDERVSSEESLNKAEVLESLKTKVEKKGEIQSKFGSITQDDSKSASLSKAFKLTQNSDEIETSLSNIYSTSKIDEYKKVKLLIVGESQLSNFDEENSHWKSAHDKDELLGKMILAMKLEEGTFLRSSLVGNSNEDQLKNILNEICTFKPDVVVTLGAISTNLLYGKKEKLSKVHGQCFERTISLNGSDHQFKFVPVFHPELLEINPSMKRTAWIDLQKIMEML